MSKTFRIRRGADIRLAGEAPLNIADAPFGDVYAVQPPDFHGLVPKMVVKEGAEVQAGTPLFHDKYNPSIQFVAPVSGEIAAVVRGAKRRILEVRILADKEKRAIQVDVSGQSSRDGLLELLLANGFWPAFRKRPFDVVANPNETPKGIFVSGFDSAPLAPDPDFVMQGREDDFKRGMQALVTLANGGLVHLGLKRGSSLGQGLTGVQVSTFDGPHPAGNVGVQIHKIAPLNKGEVAWTIAPQDVANIGQFLASGKPEFLRTVAVAGSAASRAGYFRTTLGAPIASLTGPLNGDVRIISGDVLTGTQTTSEGFIGFYDHVLSLIPEGHEAQFFLTKGWLGPGLDKFSVSRAFPTWLLPKRKKFDLNTNMNGEHRAFVVSGQYEQVFPFDIYPVQLVKAIMVNDIDAMEKLGIYEVAPEDFALCEYACTSKIEVQRIVREGLDTVHAEFS